MKRDWIDRLLGLSSPHEISSFHQLDRQERLDWLWAVVKDSVRRVCKAMIPILALFLLWMNWKAINSWDLVISKCTVESGFAFLLGVIVGKWPTIKDEIAREKRFRDDWLRDHPGRFPPWERPRLTPFDE